VTIRFGRLVDPAGNPLRGVSITGPGVWSETDDQGYFQIEAPDDAELTATTRDGRIFAVTLPTGGRGEDIAQIGTVECCGAPEVRVGVLDMPAGGGNKGSK